MGKRKETGPSKAAEFMDGMRGAGDNRLICTFCREYPKGSEMDTWVNEFVRRKRERTTSMSIESFARGFLIPEGMVVGMNTLYRHIKECCGGVR